MKTSRWPGPRRAKHARWGATLPAGAAVLRWARRILEHRSTTLTKPLERVLDDLTHYDLELVAWCCSHVEVVAAAGVVVRSQGGLLFHMLERGGTKREGFHDLATPNEDEHQEQLARLRSPVLPRRRPKAFDQDQAVKPDAIAPIDEAVRESTAALAKRLDQGRKQ